MKLLTNMKLQCLTIIVGLVLGTSQTISQDVNGMSNLEKMLIRHNGENQAETTREVLAPVYIPTTSSTSTTIFTTEAPTTTTPTSTTESTTTASSTTPTIVQKNHGTPEVKTSESKKTAEKNVSTETKLNLSQPYKKENNKEIQSKSGGIVESKSSVSWGPLLTSIGASMLLGGIVFYNYADTESISPSARSDNNDLAGYFDKGAKVIRISDLSSDEIERLKDAHSYRVTSRSNDDYPEDNSEMVVNPYTNLAKKFYNAVVPDFMKIDDKPKVKRTRVFYVKKAADDLGNQVDKDVTLENKEQSILEDPVTSAPKNHGFVPPQLRHYAPIDLSEYVAAHPLEFIPTSQDEFVPTAQSSYSVPVSHGIVSEGLPSYSDSFSPRSIREEQPSYSVPTRQNRISTEQSSYSVPVRQNFIPTEEQSSYSVPVRQNLIPTEQSSYSVPASQTAKQSSYSAPVNKDLNPTKQSLYSAPIKQRRYIPGDQQHLHTNLKGIRI